MNLEKEAAKAMDVLIDGGVILIPTETVFGLSCDASNAEAVERIMQLKQRPENKSFLVLVPNLFIVDGLFPGAAEKYVGLDQEMDTDRAITYITQPIPKAVSENCLAEDGSIGIRVPNYYGPQSMWMAELMRNMMFPIVSTSANISGQSSNGSLKQVPESIISGVDYAFPYDYPGQSQPSRIVRHRADGRLEIIRG